MRVDVQTKVDLLVHLDFFTLDHQARTPYVLHLLCMDVLKEPKTIGTIQDSVCTVYVILILVHNCDFWIPYFIICRKGFSGMSSSRIPKRAQSNIERR